MERMEWTFKDDPAYADRFPYRDRWPAGVWDTEPDKVQWPDASTGLPCLALRNHMGAWCGYVGLPPGHPWREQSYESIPAEVNGGITFGPAPCSDNETGICHVVHDSEEDDVRWIGFDCLHLNDTAPGMMASEAIINEQAVAEGRETFDLWSEKESDEWFMQKSYKTLAFVTAEVTSLAAQADNAWTH